MKFVYNTGIKAYTSAIKTASLFNDKAKLWVEGRKNIFQRLESDFKENKAKVIWIHAASLGEFEQARPLIEKLKQKYPDKKILLTFFSPSGYEVRKNYEIADYIYYLPADTSKNAKQFIKIVKPEIVYFIKYEFWKNYLYNLYINKIPTYLVSGIFRESQVFFKNSGKSYSKVLNYFTHFFVQNQTSLSLLKSIGITNVTVSGDTRFDRVIDIANQTIDLKKVSKFCNNKQVIIAGSSWQPDEELLAKYINNSKFDVKLIIAPHEIKEQNILRIKKLLNKKVLLYSDINNVKPEDYDVLIINNIGLLSSLYKYADIAYIGGGFGVGIHNILEPATFGKPIVFGTKYKKFKEAVDLIELNAAFSISNYNELKNIFNKLLSDNEYLKQTSEISANFVQNNAGAVKLIISKT